MIYSPSNLVRLRQLSGRVLLLAILLLPGLLPAAEGEAGIAAAHPLASEAGMAILKQGGNAFDAAVTVAAVLAVVEPYSSGLGGGGFWLLHRAEDGFEVMVDGRERAPLAAGADLYLDPQGEVIPGSRSTVRWRRASPESRRRWCIWPRIMAVCR